MSVTENIDWKKFYFSFEGRMNRKKYWMNFFVVFLLVSIVLGVLDAILGLSFGESDESGVLSTIFGLVCVWPSIAISAKRLHDRGYSGWWQAAPIVAVIVAGIGFSIFKLLGIIFGIVAGVLSFWLAIVIGFLKGTDGPNRFGADPLQPAPEVTGSDNDKGAGAQDIKIEPVGAGE